MKGHRSKNAKVTGLEKEAAEWFARMRGPHREASRGAFAAWYAERANAQAYERHQRMWDKTKFLANSATARGRDLDRARRRTFEVPRAVAAILVLACITGGAALVASRTHDIGTPLATLARLEAAPVDRPPRRMALPDGSIVLLDRGARLQVAYDGRERRLRLLRGRARFTVAHDADHPFVVDARQGQVIAHGTVFDVTTDDVRTSVDLLEGAVEVRRPLKRDSAATPGRARVDLVAGQRVEIAASGSMPVTAIASGDGQWTSDMLTLDGLDLAEAVRRFNTTSRIHVVAPPDLSGRFRISGTFRRGDPHAFARQVAATFGLEVTARANGDLALVSARSAP